LTDHSSEWEEQDLASAAFRHTMGLFPTGVALLTSGTGECMEGITVNSMISVSLEPLLVLVSLRRTSRIVRQITVEEKAFTLNILAADQEHVARMFARSDRCRGVAAGAYLQSTSTRAGGLLVAGALAAVQCDLDQVYPAGDHDLVLGRVVAIHSGRTSAGPLVFHRGEYAQARTGGEVPTRQPLVV
jgi:flavin reductase (DIM6/NTAB) family NADH-FMN oxidoreductase RutF